MKTDTCWLLSLEITLSDLRINRLIKLDQTVEFVWVTVWLISSYSVHFAVTGFCKYGKETSGVALNLIEQSTLFAIAVVFQIQGDSGGKVGIVTCDNIIGRCEKKQKRWCFIYRVIQ
jgi:hypothetical protein